jgi:mannose-6-phosphate isomerase-like protein (cupin superfamily)
MRKVSKYEPLHHYQWGNGCDGWVLADLENLSVKQERMPPLTSEALHYHVKAQQFFFILKGIEPFEVEDKRFSGHAGEGFQIEPTEKHRIINNTAEDLEFILSSQPSTNNDRYNVT